MAPGMEIGYVVRDASTWKVDADGEESGFDVEYYSKLLERAWKEMAFAFERN